MSDQVPTIHVYYGPDHEITAFVDEHLREGDALLSYRHHSTTNARDERGDAIPDGWILTYPDGDEEIVGAWDIDGVDQAVNRSKELLTRWRQSRD